MVDEATVYAQRGTRIEFAGVEKAYGPTTVLHGIDLDIAPGEFVALLGPSGCGKTTLLRCLAGLEGVTGGTIAVDGRDIARVPANRRDMGVVFQAYSLFPHMTVGQNVEFGLRMRRVARDERATRVREALELVGLGHLSGRFAHTLSGGQQQRVALARALVTRPQALLLDEPLSALDAKVRVRLRDEIRAIQTELGITTIFVTHDQEEALAIADRVAVMNGGVIEQLGAPEDLYRRPETPFVAGFIGESNRIEGVYGSSGIALLGTRLPVLGAARAGFRDASSGDDERGDGGDGGDAAGLVDGTAVRAFVRPEHLVIVSVESSPVDPIAPAGSALSGVVVSSGFLGAQRRTVVRLSGGDLLTVQHPAHQLFAADERVRLEFAGEPVAVERAAEEPA